MMSIRLEQGAGATSCCTAFGRRPPRKPRASLWTGRGHRRHSTNSTSVSALIRFQLSLSLSLLRWWWCGSTVVVLLLLLTSPPETLLMVLLSSSSSILSPSFTFNCTTCLRTVAETLQRQFSALVMKTALAGETYLDTPFPRLRWRYRGMVNPPPPTPVMYHSRI